MSGKAFSREGKAVPLYLFEQTGTRCECAHQLQVNFEAIRSRLKGALLELAARMRSR